MKTCHCPIGAVASMLGKKWVIMLLRDLFMGKTRFKEFLEANPDLSNKVLSQKLKEMEEDGLINKSVDPDSAEINYTLTPQGKKLKPVMLQMVMYGRNYCDSPKHYEELLARFKTQSK